MKRVKKLKWDFGENCDAESLARDGQVDFFCGVIDSEHGGFDEEDDHQTPILEALFHDREVDIGAAECYHMISGRPGETIQQLRKLLRDRLSTIATKFR